MLKKIKAPDIKRNKELQKYLFRFFDEVEFLKFNERPDYDLFNHFLDKAVSCIDFP